MSSEETPDQDLSPELAAAISRAESEPSPTEDWSDEDIEDTASADLVDPGEEVSPESVEEADTGGEGDLDELLAKLTANEGAQATAQDALAGNARPAYQNPALHQELAEEGPPLWLGTRWREITGGDQRAVWLGLRGWVDWLINEYRLPKSVIPACWHRHTELVAELYGLMCMEHKVWEEGAPSVNPTMIWASHLQAATGRMRIAVENLGGCGKDQHTEPEFMVRDYDEDLWRDTVYSRRETVEIPRPEAGEKARLVRAKLLSADKNGEATETYSPLIGVAAARGRGEPTATVTGRPIPGSEDLQLRLLAEHVDEHTDISWESAISPEGPWKPLEEGHPDSGQDGSGDPSWTTPEFGPSAGERA